MSEIESRFVKHGVWTNLDQGPVMGKTITTDQRTGNLVVALIAILSTLGTGHLWHLLSFAYHQVRANGRPADALFRQQQALLRTLPTPGTAMVDGFKLWWAWKRKARRSFLRSVSLVLVAMLFSVSTIAASIFSSLIVDTSDLIVLVDSKFCTWTNDNATLDRIDPISTLAISDPFADLCYRNASSEDIPTACSIYVRPNIPFTRSRVPCPFASGWCVGGFAISLDSGLLDVSKDFGLNIPSSSGMKYRKKSTCAILPLQNHTQVINKTDYPGAIGQSALPGEQALLLNYGARVDDPGNASAVTSLLLSNLTDAIDLLPALVHYSQPISSNPSSFTPIPELAHNASILVLRIVQFNSAKFATPSSDSLYSANIPVDVIGQVYNTSAYLADFPVKGLGCLEQYQFCYVHSGADVCTDLAGLPNGAGPAVFPDANTVQRMVLRLIVTSSYSIGMSSATKLLNDRSRNADGSANNFLQATPNDYWIEEVAEWENQFWAAMQVTIADFAVGKVVRPVQIDVINRVKPDEKSELCGTQKMRKSGDIVNINFFGLVFIMSFSLFITLIDITLLKFLIFLSRFRRGLGPRIERWVQDGVWQLQRRAYEGEGHRDWIDVEKDIPMTTDPRLLADLPVMWTPDKNDRASVVESRSSMGSARLYENGRLPEIVGWI